MSLDVQYIQYGLRVPDDSNEMVIGKVMFRLIVV